MVLRNAKVLEHLEQNYAEAEEDLIAFCKELSEQEPANLKRTKPICDYDQTVLAQANDATIN